MPRIVQFAGRSVVATNFRRFLQGDDIVSHHVAQSPGDIGPPSKDLAASQFPPGVVLYER